MSTENMSGEITENTCFVRKTTQIVYFIQQLQLLQLLPLQQLQMLLQQLQLLLQQLQLLLNSCNNTNTNQCQC